MPDSCRRECDTTRIVAVVQCGTSMVLHLCGYVAVRRYSIVVRNGDGRTNVSRLTLSFRVVIVSPSYGCCTALTVEIGNTIIYIVALDKELRVLTGVDAVASCSAAEVVVQHVDLTNASHRHTLFAARSPPVECKGSIQVTRCLAVTTANEVGVLVHVRTAGIAEGTPADGMKV